MPVFDSDGIVTSRPNRPWSEDELDRLMQMLAGGATRNEIAAKLGRTPNSVKHGRFRLASEGRWSEDSKSTV